MRLIPSETRNISVARHMQYASLRIAFTSSPSHHHTVEIVLDVHNLPNSLLGIRTVDYMVSCLPELLRVDAVQLADEASVVLPHMLHLQILGDPLGDLPFLRAPVSCCHCRVQRHATLGRSEEHSSLQQSCGCASSLSAHGMSDPTRW